MTRPYIIQEVEPIELEGGSRGVLLIHGFTETPQSFRYLSQDLHRNKFSVLAPLLAGHGTRAEDLEKTTWHDWYASVETAYQKLRKKCDQVSVCGLSMGGLLSLHLAAHHREIQSIGLLATPLFLDNWLLRYVFPIVWNTPLKHLYRFQKKMLVSIRNPHEGRRYQAYEKIPVTAVANLLELQKKVRKELHSIHQPTFIAHALGDTTVPYGNLDYVKACLGSERVETLTLKKSNHIITVDYDREIVAKRLIKFFKNSAKK